MRSRLTDSCRPGSPLFSSARTTAFSSKGRAIVDATAEVVSNDGSKAVAACVDERSSIWPLIVEELLGSARTANDDGKRPLTDENTATGTKGGSEVGARDGFCRLLDCACACDSGFFLLVDAKILLGSRPHFFGAADDEVWSTGSDRGGVSMCSGRLDSIFGAAERRCSVAEVLNVVEVEVVEARETDETVSTVDDTD